MSRARRGEGENRRAEGTGRFGTEPLRIGRKPVSDALNTWRGDAEPSEKARRGRRSEAESSLHGVTWNKEKEPCAQRQKKRSGIEPARRKLE